MYSESEEPVQIRAAAAERDTITLLENLDFQDASGVSTVFRLH